MNKSLYLFAVLLVLFGCDEAYESDNSESGNTSPPVSDFSPSGSGAYWIYDVESSSSQVSDMNFTTMDSIYVATNNGNSFTLDANDDGIASGNMNILLTNGTLNKTSITLVFDGAIDVPENLADLGFTQDLSIEDMTLLDLNASNGGVLFLNEGDFSETIDIQGVSVPVEVQSKITTTTINLHDTKTLNGTDYDNVFEGEFALNISISGSFTVAGITQTIPILEAQDVMKTTYFYVDNIGLVRAETVQGINLSNQLTALLSLLNITLDIPTTVAIENVEELKNFSVE
jgi:hypothetical protein